MINFIICDDNSYVRELNKKLISKITMPYDFNYAVYCFEKYSIKFRNLINSPNELNIYILDLELLGKSGLEIAREIRKSDWDSIIIILTSHDELELKMLKEKLLILDFISKFDNYEKSLTDTINMVLNKVNTKKKLSFKSNKELHNVVLDNIYYIYKDSTIDKSVIVTNKEIYPISESLTNILKRLDGRFYQSHRACIINLNKVATIDFKDNIIQFDNGEKIDYLSRNYKKGLRKRL